MPKKISSKKSPLPLKYSEVCTSLYETDTVEILRQKNMSFLSILREMNCQFNILVILDVESNENTENLAENVCQCLLQSLDPSLQQDLNLFKTVVNVIQNNMNHEDMLNRLVLKMNESSSDKSLRVFMNLENCSDNEYETPPPSNREVYIPPAIDALVVVSTVRGIISTSLKQKLTVLERFPVLFLLCELERCNDIYEAIRQKEEAELDVLEIYSTHYKPLILFFQDHFNFKEHSNSIASMF